MTTFKLRFPISRIAALAARFPGEDDEEIERDIAPAARARGYLLRREFLRLCEWKTPRTRSLCASNSPQPIRSATRLAFATSDPSESVTHLMQLRGVALPTASVILHFCAPDPYPILDVRALWSLGAVGPVSRYRAVWPEYVTATREIARRARCDMRTLDRALWQYSKESESTFVARSWTDEAD